ncbi:hypothetical protein HELRODRAFT_177748 [Helobdella robusta]|uniref:EGF-like domain-containing protein n=1 Tax=Helobdella robusta TaxID=6412 RepID=T1FC67_HELRO|nr:hypothetical protein HELRODRAFT_177748 [Helobdella robusta]ESN97693.1 hypothetical protein HELRODRAFT_177748 [Helobdella robusta]
MKLGRHIADLVFVYLAGLEHSVIGEEFHKKHSCSADCATQNGGCNTTMNCVQEIVNGLMLERCLCKTGYAAVDENECIVLDVLGGEDKSISLMYIIMIGFAVSSFLLVVAILMFKHLKKHNRNGMKHFEIH